MMDNETKTNKLECTKSDQEARPRLEVDNGDENALMMASIRKMLVNRSSGELRDLIAAGAGSRWSVEAIVAMQQILDEREGRVRQTANSQSSESMNESTFATKLVWMLRGLAFLTLFVSLPAISDAMAAKRNSGRLDAATQIAANRAVYSSMLFATAAFLIPMTLAEILKIAVGVERRLRFQESRLSIHAGADMPTSGSVINSEK